MADHFSPVLYVLRRALPAGAPPRCGSSPPRPSRWAPPSCRCAASPGTSVSRPDRATLPGGAAAARSSPPALFDFHPSTARGARSSPLRAPVRPAGPARRPRPSPRWRSPCAGPTSPSCSLAIAMVAAPRVRLAARGGRRRSPPSPAPWSRAGSARPTAGLPHFGHLGASPSQALLAPLGRRRPARCPARAWPSSPSLGGRRRRGDRAAPALAAGRRWWPGSRCSSRAGRAPACPGTTTARRWRPSPSGGTLAGLAVAAGPRRPLVAAAPGRLVGRSGRSSCSWPARCRRRRRQPTGCGRVALGDDGRDVAGAVALVGDDDAVSADQHVLAAAEPARARLPLPDPLRPCPRTSSPRARDPDLDQYGPRRRRRRHRAGGAGGRWCPPAASRWSASSDGLVVLRRVDDAEPSP